MSTLTSKLTYTRALGTNYIVYTDLHTTKLHYSLIGTNYMPILTNKLNCTEVLGTNYMPILTNKLNYTKALGTNYMLTMTTQ